MRCNEPEFPPPCLVHKPDQKHIQVLKFISQIPLHREEQCARSLASMGEHLCKRATHFDLQFDVPWDDLLASLTQACGPAPAWQARPGAIKICTSANKDK